MSVSFADTMASFQFWCTGDSAADTMRVPICTASAPRARAAAMVAPSVKPPAAMMGKSVRDRTRGRSTRVETSFGFLNPPPSAPSTTKPSTPASMAFRAASRVGTTWKTVSPAAFSSAV